MPDAYSIFEIQPEWLLEQEAMGSKDKFWYRVKNDEPEWLFKFPQPNTGQHWAEKIAAEVAACMDVLHGVVELAVFQGTRGSATESFARDGRNLFHGNQMLAGKVIGYDPSKEFRQCDHTLENIFLAVDRTFKADVYSGRNWTAFRFNLDSVPIQIGHRSDLIWTVIRGLFGQFLGAVGTVSNLDRNGCPNSSESATGRPGADDADIIPALRMHDNQQSLPSGLKAGHRAGRFGVHALACFSQNRLKPGHQT